jgi:hypothetical protein
VIVSEARGLLFACATVGEARRYLDILSKANGDAALRSCHQNYHPKFELEYDLGLLLNLE